MIACAFRAAHILRASCASLAERLSRYARAIALVLALKALLLGLLWWACFSPAGPGPGKPGAEQVARNLLGVQTAREAAHAQP